MGGLTDTELKRAKAKLIGQKKIARQDLGSYAMTTALDELYGLGYQSCDSEDARYESVSLEDIHAVAPEIPQPGGLHSGHRSPGSGKLIAARKRTDPAASHPRDRRVVHAKHPYQPEPLNTISGRS